MHPHFLLLRCNTSFTFYLSFKKTPRFLLNLLFPCLLLDTLACLRVIGVSYLYILDDSITLIVNLTHPYNEGKPVNYFPGSIKTYLLQNLAYSCQVNYVWTLAIYCGRNCSQHNPGNTKNAISGLLDARLRYS